MVVAVGGGEGVHAVGSEKVEEAGGEWGGRNDRIVPAARRDFLPDYM